MRRVIAKKHSSPRGTVASAATGRSRRAAVFICGHSQAVRIPKDLRLSCSQVSIRREGVALVLEPCPADDDWGAVFAGIRPGSTLRRLPQPPLPPIRRVEDDDHAERE